MDTKLLIEEAKARFSHISAKTYLKEKYLSKLIVADQGGLWKADAQTISFLSCFTSDRVVIIDTFDNPVEVERKVLLDKLVHTYEATMKEWYSEWTELESKR